MWQLEEGVVEWWAKLKRFDVWAAFAVTVSERLLASLLRDVLREWWARKVV